MIAKRAACAILRPQATSSRLYQIIGDSYSDDLRFQLPDEPPYAGGGPPLCPPLRPPPPRPGRRLLRRRLLGGRDSAGRSPDDSFWLPSCADASLLDGSAATFSADVSPSWAGGGEPSSRERGDRPCRPRDGERSSRVRRREEPLLAARSRACASAASCAGSGGGTFTSVMSSATTVINVPSSLAI